METRAKRNHNPLNIERSANNNWKGLTSTQTDPRFCTFREDIWGFRAAIIILKKYIAPKNLGGYGLKTIKEIISKWAPSSENNTEAYIKFVESSTHINKNLPILTYGQLIKVIKAMSKYESGYDYNESVIWEAMGMLEFAAINSNHNINTLCL